MTLLACICLTVLIVKGSIFKHLRAGWPAFFECPLCLGFWVGQISYWLAHISEGWLWQWVLPSLERGVVTAVGALAVYLVLGLVKALWVLVDNENATKHVP